MSVHPSDAQSQIIKAIQSGEFNKLEQALACGGDFDFRMNSGMTPTMLAAYEGQAECLALLIQSGADVNAQDIDGWTAAMHATRRGEIESLALLIGSGSELSLSNRWGNTALQLAQNGQYPDCVEMIQAALEARHLNASLGSVAPAQLHRPPQSLRL